MDASVLLKKRREAAKQRPQLEKVLRGSIVIVKRSCGKAGCRCQRGQKHQSLYVSQSNNGKTRMIYIPHKAEDETRRWVDNYRALKNTLEKISEINIQMLTKG